MLSPELKQLKQLPSGVKDYLDVNLHQDILKIPAQ
jgi:hypothetical protein